jgi:hypothetical protein
MKNPTTIRLKPSNPPGPDNFVAGLNVAVVVAGLETELDEDDDAVTGTELEETGLDITLEEELST